MTSTIRKLIWLFAAGSLFAAEDSRVTMRETRSGVLIEDLVFKSRHFNDYVAAYRICPAANSTGPAAVFAHWVDRGEPSSNRSQFVDEAVELAQKGACSLLVETMWSQADWFPFRDLTKDRVATERQRDRLADAVEFLLSSPKVDKTRVAFVGHDFGGMFGALLAATETRVHYWAFQAATPRWHEWYLLGRDKLNAKDKQAAMAATADLDPISAISRARGSFFLQFSTNDKYVPRERAQQFFDAAPESKKLAWYEAGHGMNPQANRDRVAWLSECLGLKGKP